MIKEKDAAWAMEQLQIKYRELNRIPKKDDFDEVTRARIKAFLGPWPRALEAAGLKQPVVKTEKSGKRKKSQNKKEKCNMILKKAEDNHMQNGEMQ